jgi:uncharacterized membrane protein YqjE
MEPSNAEEPGLMESVKRLGRTVLGIAENRLELLLVELEEERWRTVRVLLLIGCATVLALMTLIVSTITIVMVCGPERRILALLILSGLYLTGTIMVVTKLRRHLREWQSFPATLAELKKDRTRLDARK